MTPFFSWTCGDDCRACTMKSSRDYTSTAYRNAFTAHFEAAPSCTTIIIIRMHRTNICLVDLEIIPPNYSRFFVKYTNFGLFHDSTNVLSSFTKSRFCPQKGLKGIKNGVSQNTCAILMVSEIKQLCIVQVLSGIFLKVAKPAVPNH